MKQEFLDYLNELQKAAPQVQCNEEAQKYLDFLTREPAVQESKKQGITQHGKEILTFVHENPIYETFTSKELADGMGISGRSVAGSLRKLVAEEYVEKLSAVGVSPITYGVTNKGKNIEF